MRTQKSKYRALALQEYPVQATGTREKGTLRYGECRSFTVRPSYAYAAARTMPGAWQLDEHPADPARLVPPITRPESGEEQSFCSLK